MTIIGIGHTKRAGKDTAANALVRDLNFRKLSFADPLKELAMEADPIITPAGGQITVNTAAGRGRMRWVVAGNGWEAAKDQWPEVRRYLQELGRGAREVLGDHVWIQALENKMTYGIDYVIADVRFQNEADWVKEIGGQLIKIERPGVGFGDGHISETALKDYPFDYVIKNDGSIMDLENKVTDLVRGLKNKEALRADSQAG